MAWPDRPNANSLLARRQSRFEPGVPGYAVQHAHSDGQPLLRLTAWNCAEEAQEASPLGPQSAFEAELLVRGNSRDPNGSVLTRPAWR